jgi:hypothetical protein
MKPRSLAFALLILVLVFGASALADTASFDQSYLSKVDADFPKITWDSTDFPILEKKVGGVTSSVAIITGGLPGDWSLIFEADSRSEKCELQDRKAKEKSFSCSIPVKDQKPFKLLAISSYGVTTEWILRLIIQPHKQSYWTEQVHLSLPFGVYTATTASGGSGSTYMAINSMKIGGEIAFRRAFSESDPAFESSFAGEIGYMLPNLGVSFPPSWKLDLTFMARNLRKLNAAGTVALSPKLSFQFESFSSLSNEIAPTGAFEFSYEYRLTQPFWIGLGSEVRVRIHDRDWEFTPLISYSPYASTNLSESGMQTTLSGWKLDLKTTLPIWKKAGIGIDLSAFYLRDNSTQVMGYLSYFKVIYRFDSNK